ncbi:MAG: hypothetical protein JXB24_04795 [Bacteroidales bacterium]|nr:hypothetical protein [Bacteroidales bacterium]
MKRNSATRIIKRLFIVIFTILTLSFELSAQEETVTENEFAPNGHAFGKVFWNYNYNVTKDAEQRNSFALQRAYLGYQYNFSEKISTKITLDGSGSSEASDFTVFLKTAQLDWNATEPVKLSFGLMGLKQFDTQEKLWGYRYIFKSLQDEYKFGSSADLGVNAEVSIIQNLTANLFILNGEGYKHIQDDMGRIKAGGNLIYTPVKGLILKGYYDIYDGKVEVNDSVSKDTCSIHTLSFFAGYKAAKFRIGAEYNILLNGTKYAKQAADHDITGIAIYGTYVINKKFEVFGQWMLYKSNKSEDSDETWNYDEDGNLFLAGIQYAPVKGVKVAANYRAFLYDNPDINTDSYFFLNFEYAF